MIGRADAHLMPQFSADRSALRRAAVLAAAPLAVYALARPIVKPDALALGIAGTIPVIYSVALAVVSRRIDPLALVTAIGFALACAVSVATGGSSLALKLHEAAITFTVGLVVLGAVLIGRPFPLAVPLRIPSPTKAIDGSLGVIVGAFLMLHALLHLVLAVSLSTGSYLAASRLVNWGTLAVGIAALSMSGRRLRARVPGWRQGPQVGPRVSPAAARQRRRDL